MKRIALALALSATMAACAGMQIFGRLGALQACQRIEIAADKRPKVIEGLGIAANALQQGEFVVADATLSKLPLTPADIESVNLLIDVVAEQFDGGFANPEYPLAAAQAVRDCIKGIESQSKTAALSGTITVMVGVKEDSRRGGEKIETGEPGGPIVWPLS